MRKEEKAIKSSKNRSCDYSHFIFVLLHILYTIFIALKSVKFICSFSSSIYEILDLSRGGHFGDQPYYWIFKNQTYRMFLKFSCDFLCTALPKYKSTIFSTTKKSKRGGGMGRNVIENLCSRYSFLWARTPARVRSETLFYKFAHFTKILSSSRWKKS